jgi:hypothetical protein
MFFLIFIPVTFAGSANFSPYQIPDSLLSVYQTRKNLLSQTINAPAFHFSYSLLSVLFDWVTIEPRGKMTGNQIRLSMNVARDSEFLGLFVHEFAHFIDINVLTHPDSMLDPSNDFYSISWEDTKTKLPGESLNAFVTGYAATNKYEDFAESFTFFVFHNRVFADRALRNESLRKKYIFLMEKVFPHNAFVDTDFSLGIVPSYSWDSTKIPISLKKYLYSLD